MRVFDVVLDPIETDLLFKMATKKHSTEKAVLKRASSYRNTPALMEPPALEEFGSSWELTFHGPDGKEIEQTAYGKLWSPSKLMRSCLRHYLVNVGGYNIPGM